MMAARICLKIGVVVSFASLAKIPVFTASDEVDCRAAVKSGYVSGDPVPHTCTAQLPLKDTETEIINSVRDEYQDYPVRCRYGKDYCGPTSTYDIRRGEIQWPVTEAGVQRVVHCPYAYLDALYATFDCSLTYAANQTVRWSNLQNKTCPDPPFTRAIDDLYKSVLAKMNETGEAPCGRIIRSIDPLFRTRHFFLTHPVFPGELYQLTAMTRLYTDYCLTSSASPSNELVRLWSVVDLLFNDSLAFMDARNFSSFVQHMTQLFPAGREPFRFEGRNVHVEHVVETDDDAIVLRHSLTNDVSTVSATLSTLPANRPGPGREIRMRAILLLQTGGAAVPAVRFLLHRLVGHVHLPVPPRPPLQPPDSATGPPDLPAHASSENNDSSDGRFRTVTEESSDITTGTTAKTVTEEAKLLNSSWPSPAGTVTRLRSIFDVYIYQQVNMIGPVIYVSFVTDENTTTSNNEFELLLRHPQYKEKFTSNSTSEVQPTCGYASYQPSSTANDQNDVASVLEWSDVGCELRELDGDKLRCRCNISAGFVTVLTETQPLGMSPSEKGNEKEKSRANDLSTFLGFPYRYELYIVGQVMKAVSLACLLATICTYVVFPKARRGTVTHILMNLCSALTTLLAVLYLAAVFAHSRLGCRVANVCRYYLVLVSLCWNGIEAHNMYRMLVKVFNTAQQTHFVLKAAVVAWGVPAVAVALGFAGSVKTFDGNYDDCVFRCALRQTTLYYGWLLPMSIIILHNLIVFGLVLRVLCRKQPGESVGGKRGHWTRLYGACTMLVLLGVPWVFSAFAVIDSEGSSDLEMLQGIFNVVFVVSVNLQGLFIFCFHCVRNASVRSEWKSVFTRVSAYRSAMQTSTLTASETSATDSSRHLFQRSVQLPAKNDETKL